MAEAGGAGREPGVIGEVVAPPFVKLPDPAKIFVSRATRFRALAAASALGPYLQFLGGLSDIQHDIQDGLAAIDGPSAEQRARAREFGLPPLDRHRFAPDTTFDETLRRLVARADALAMPEPARHALARLAAFDEAARALLVRGVLDDAVPADALAEHLFVAAALQVHFSRLAATLESAALGPVGTGACPACGGAPVASLIVGWPSASGARYCACSVCQTLWNNVRAACVVCGSTDGISYQEIEGGEGTIKAESCGKCGCYVKVMHQHKDAALDPVADDVASLGLDLMLRETGARRGAVNPLLIGY
jgi:FdhE protein